MVFSSKGHPMIARVAGGLVLASVLVAGAAAAAVGGDALPRFSILGASASAGFSVVVNGPGGDGPGIASARLGTVLRAMVDPPPCVVADWSTASFFSDPCTTGPHAVERCIQGEPDAVIAVDFLFWFAYGAFTADGRRISQEADRDALFELGLSLLDQVEAPLLVGDLPDMRGANPRVLNRWSVPEPETLERLNRRLRKWAADRPKVRIFPLAERTREAMTATFGGDPAPTDPPEAGQVPESTNPPESAVDSAGPKRPPLVQRDRLHPTFEGLFDLTAAVAVAMADLPGFDRIAAEIDSLGHNAMLEQVRARLLELDRPPPAGSPNSKSSP